MVVKKKKKNVRPFIVNFIYVLQNSDDDSIAKEGEIRCQKKLLMDLVQEYRTALSKVVELAKIVNYDVGNLECQKIDIDQHINDIVRTDTVAKAHDCVRYIHIHKSGRPDHFKN